MSNAWSCSMCMSACIKAKIHNYIYGAPSESDMNPNITIFDIKKKERERIDQFILEQEEFIERINRDIISLQEEMEEKDHIVLDEPIDYERLKELAESESNENFLNQLYMLIKDSKELKFQKKTY